MAKTSKAKAKATTPKRSAETDSPSKAGHPAEAKSGDAKTGGAPSPLLFERLPLWSRPGYLVRRVHQIHQALFLEECKDFEITPVQYGLLTTLKHTPDLDQNSLGQELGLDRTNVADVLVRLSKRGLVERRKSEEDRRMVLARLTPEGERVTDEMFEAMRRAQERLLEPLLPQERNAFVTMLIRLVDGNNHLGRTVFNPK